MTRCTVVFTRHGLVEGGRRQLWLRRRIARLVDSYVAVSRQVADNTRSHRLATEPKLTVIENGIDLDQYQPRADLRAAVRAELGLSGDSLALGCVCRLAECKNVGLLLRTALPHLSQTTQLFIVGDGPERRALESLVSQHPNRAFARFLGQRSDVARLLNGFDLFALSSRTEGHPLAVIEAMATGLPVLATAVGGIPEMIEDDVTGFLSRPDETGFAERLTSALDRCRSWPAMGEAARASARQRFSSQTMAERYLTLYETIRRGAAQP
jgi:glycosyltransferase involved in cell wall biosynthesis